MRTRALAGSIVAAVACLALPACSSRERPEQAAAAKLPAECASYVTSLEACLRGGGIRGEVLAGRVDQVRQALVDEAARAPEQGLRDRCVDAQSRVRAACR